MWGFWFCKLDFVDFWLVFVGDEQVLVFGVLGDVVEDVIGGVGGFFGFGVEVGEVDLVYYVVVGWVDLCDV